MTEEDIFIALSLKLGNPKELPKKAASLGKVAVFVIRPSLDYAQEFVALCKMMGVNLDNQWRLKRFHAKWVRWDARQKAKHS